MYKIIWAPEVIDFLAEEITYYDELDANTEAVKNIFQTFKSVCQFPKLGKPLEISADLLKSKNSRVLMERIKGKQFLEYRKLVVGKYLLVYGIKNETVHVLWIKHHTQKDYQ